ncbi:hypothetical protein [Pseudobacillus badius]|uniref:hypothetical protein n=1 Tax=Bacillus badius TaxID=1455 RepID=UPI0007B3474B|nr:hypothetical protein [Bacillus badius]KZR60388.1 hypothetical protein A3781_09455 [Bacillus badius]
MSTQIVSTDDVNALVLSTLEGIGVPVERHVYSGNATTYITFFEYNEVPALSADNDESLMGNYIQVDVWSKTNYKSLVKEVKVRLKAAGFKYKFGADLFEDDTKIYHRAMRFFYTSTPE